MSNTKSHARHGTNLSTITTTERHGRSVYMFLLQHLIKLFKGSLVKPKKTMPGGSLKLEAPKKVHKQCTVTERSVDDINIYDLVAKRKPRRRAGNGEKRQSKRIYYFGGGGWQMPPSGQHWKLVSELATKLEDTTVSLVSYPLAPNSAAPVAFPLLVKMFGTLMREAEKAQEDVILAGDSAGANVILCLTLEALRQNPNAPCPKALMCISPSTDLKRDSPEIRVFAKYDPLLHPSFIESTAAAWCGAWDPGDPRVSPCYADVTPLASRDVRVHGVCGGYDILSPEALAFRDKCAEAGVKGEWLYWTKQMHCFPLTFEYKLPEGVQGKDWILDVLQTC